MSTPTMLTPMESAEIQQAYTDHELDVFGKRGLEIVRGEGAWLFDSAGKRFLDCIAGIGVCNLGHAHPDVLDALHGQAAKLINCPGFFHNDAKAAFLKALVSVAPAGLNRAFLCNSGTESVEGAIKFARISTGRQTIITAKRGFHGRTYGAMSATPNKKLSEGCGELVAGFQHVRFNDIEALRAAVNGETAALLLEVIQGEGGVYPADPEYIAAARALCDEHGALLIVDEVQTGFCRTGRFFACEHYDLKPDILTLAKAIASGLPMGAILVADHVEVPIGRHGSTFGGNPLVCAVATRVIEVMQRDNLAQRAEERGRYFLEGLQKQSHPQIRAFRQRGLMIGVELKIKSKPILKRLMALGVLVMTSGATTLRFLPPLTIERDEIDIAVAAFHQVLNEEADA
ncbi:aspartate aminotransferase family protein [Acanthopleuribacter pedis]|uniref:Acetylornithine/succinylornithine family transaminase n=1 Tax=Acanthopleuribacter pedis TaxID=442870 RepID=A0A8J7QBZ3_9BACT|nr:acetylornithine/succinylornithine family transaminase [Acanthopleuribacter pedis]MBO1321642.1 acetylornithine/succinylornithine family transaminase [Acanthopleuribacter pedis]